ncbi:hypothetical protein BUALT_Bualt17G0045000 [Buddleja alternifolia]|uniref:SWIM-type domain-containing protein n=1 Tax=Buddleja alternifolia TaxID=168488 RepID=A0AAV6WBL8_9LAMI|nr:hypothetical protein BUALT_Bualt17G0045000 [Buddleja alternifolia]
MSMKNAGLRPIDFFNYVTEECHGVQHVGFSKKDCYNFIKMLKAGLIELGDAQNLVRYFKSKANIEPGFYFDIQFNQEGRMANVFWAHSSIFTDQDQAMANAIADVFPMTRHHLYFFHGGVRSTSRSESTNHALNEISIKTISLSEFVLKFEKDLLGKWRRNEADADFFSSQSTSTLAVNSKLLNHTVRIYTNTIYKEFERDYLNGTGALSCKGIPVGDTLYEFDLTNSESYNDRVYTIFLDINTLKVECSCKKIHWTGMLCSHALAALHRKNVHEIPQAYIHNRWTKDVKKHAYMMDGYKSTRIDDNEARVLYTSRAMRFAYDLVTQSESCKEARDIMWTVLKDGARSLDEFYKKKNIDSTSRMKDKFVRNDIVELHKDKSILDPLKAKPKGTRNRRIKNHFEKRKSKIPLTDTKRDEEFRSLQLWRSSKALNILV